MFLGLPWGNISFLILVLISMSTPFWRIAHTIHALKRMGGVLLLTILCCVLYLIFVHMRAAELFPLTELVLLKSYALSSSVISFFDELFSTHDEERWMRMVRIGIITPLAVGMLVFLIGGIRGNF